MVCAICNVDTGVEHKPWCTRQPTSAERYGGFQVGETYGRADADVAPTPPDRKDWTVDDIRRDRESRLPVQEQTHQDPGLADRLEGPAVAQEGLNPKDLIGCTKTPLGLLPWTALVQVAKVFAVGAKKYGAYNWRTKGQPVQHVTYVEAAFRHLAAYMDGQTIDPETGCNHLAHAACGLLILLDAQAVGNSIDNRPTPGNAAEIMALK